MPESTIGLSDVAVITVSYNSSEILGSFLGSLLDGESVPARVIIADNASTDLAESRAIAEQYGADLLPIAKNVGYGGAINAAARDLDEAVRWILVTNPDITFTPQAISTLAEVARATPDAGSVGPRIIDPDGSNYPSARRLPSLRTGLGHALFVHVWPGNPWTRSYLHDRGISNAITPVGWLSGACVLVRREAFERLNGFDEGYFMYFEDVDLGYRLSKAGWSNVYAPTAVVVHSGAHSTAQESALMLRVHHDSAYRYLSRKYTGWYLAPLRWVLRAGLSIRSTWLARGMRGPTPPRAPHL